VADRTRSWRRGALLVAGTAVLTAAALATGLHRWPLPAGLGEGWRVDGVPRSLAVFLGAAALCCLALAAALTVHLLPARPRGPRAVWWAAALGAALAAGGHALVLAAHARTGVPVRPALDWALPLVPALVAGLACVTTGARPALVAALGTGVVSVPLVGLGWALYASRAAGPVLGAPLTLTLWLGVFPLLVAAGLSWAAAQAYESGTATEHN
jgi:hypothetical protein